MYNCTGYTYSLLLFQYQLPYKRTVQLYIHSYTVHSGLRQNPKGQFQLKIQIHQRANQNTPKGHDWPAGHVVETTAVDICTSSTYIVELEVGNLDLPDLEWSNVISTSNSLTLCIHTLLYITLLYFTFFILL